MHKLVVSLFWESCSGMQPHIHAVDLFEYGPCLHNINKPLVICIICTYAKGQLPVRELGGFSPDQHTR